MKTAKRVLAILMAMLMAVSAFAVAASAEDSIAAQLASGNTASISKNTKESVVISKNATIDLGGKILKSANGSPAIVVTGGATVTIKNGYVESYYNSYNGVSPELIDGIVHTAPSAIKAEGAGTKVILEDVRVMGGMVRIPKTREWYVPTGSALQLQDGATAELNSAVLVGRYGVNNDPAGTGRACGTVTINDAILFGYLDYVKRVYNGVIYDDATVEKVNAADRIVGLLNSNIHLESYELDLLDKALDDRIYIFTKKPVDDAAIVTIDKNADKATITASTVEYLTRKDGGHKSTDCSYKYVPVNAYDVETGKTYALNEDLPIAELEGKDIRINYRLEFELKGDFKKLANNFDYYFNKYYNLAIEKIDASYDEIITKYDQYIDMFADVYKMVDEAGDEGVTIAGKTYTVRDELGDDFYAILRGLLSVGGATLYKKATGETLTTLQFTNDDLYKNGDAAPAANTYEVINAPDEPQLIDYDFETGEPIYAYVADVYTLGVLDKVQHLIDAFEAIKGESSLGDQSKWNDYAHLILNNYHDVLNWIGEANTALAALETTLTTGHIGDIVTSLKLQDKVSIVSKLVSATSDAQTAVDKALELSAVQEVMDKLDRNANNGTVENYMGKVKTAINNYRTYVTPENFLAEDGTFALAYFVNGPTEVVNIEKGKLHVSAYGGVVNFISDSAGAYPATSSQWTTVPYFQAVTLNAVADEDNEFLYYMDGYTDRILSTNPTLKVDTQAERYIVAVFESTQNAVVALTNHSGVLCDTLPYNAEGIDASSVAVPVLKGYETKGWGPNGTKTLTSADFVSAYKSGNSAFENGASYNINGYAFKLNKTTSNKYLVTPKYAASEKFTITFVDGDTTWSKEIKIGNSITYTASGDNFSYWMNDKEQIVSVYRKYSVLPNEETTFYAVYDADVVDPAGYVNFSSVIEEDARFRFYAERSIPANRKVLSNGIILSFDSSIQEPEVKDINNSTVRAAYSTKTTNQDVFTISLLKSSISNSPNGVVYVRAYVEVKTATGSEFIYSDVYPAVD